ncbi:protoporphyrinogen/coproporphyrinogen oxidase [Paraburkholderia sp. BCC1886]|uniref:protoporphyrinogen/coproporphyrinogen oxidase n=1 Tax=Paraburkholderia sp. BCC1886 TaxID=2562670 RepID=UPI0021B44436|nr:NAD(P)/FAD-dependent oxidoreductase [Paraburkholderia sp. BCC1886]
MPELSSQTNMNASIDHSAVLSSVASRASSPHTVAVVGSGIAGLTAAYRLQQAGLQVTVFEGEQVVGGRMGDRKVGDIAFNSGARLVYPFGKAFNRLIADLSLGDVLVPLKNLTAQCVAPGGGRHTIELMPSARSLATPGLRLTERLAMIRHALQMRALKGRVDPDWATSAMDVDPAFDRLTLADFTRERIGPNVLKTMVEPVFRATRSFNPETLSALFYLTTVPHLIGEDTVYTLKGGMGRVCAALAAQLTVRMGTRVTSIRRHHSDATQPAMSLTLADGEVHRFDHIVCAVEGSLARQLVEAPLDAERAMLEHVRYNSLGVVHYGFAGPLPPVMDFATRDTPSRIATYQQLPAAPAQGRPLTQIYCQLTPEAAEEAQARGLTGELDVLLRDELRQRIPDFDAQVVSVVNQWIPRKLPVFSPGYGARLQAFWQWQESPARALDRPLVYCGDWTAQALLTGACASGERAAQIVLQRVVNQAPVRASVPAKN